jgi:hypothetical protein
MNHAAGAVSKNMHRRLLRARCCALHQSWNCSSLELFQPAEGGMVMMGVWSAARTTQDHIPCIRLCVLAILVLAGGLSLGWQREAWPASQETGEAAAVENSVAVPVGTILPVQLENSIATNEAQPGEAITGRIMQEVPLPTGEKIPARSRVRGSISSVENDPDDPGTKISLKFNQIEHRKETLTITTYLRALASPSAVQAAQLPHSGADFGTPAGWADTVQVGGDVRYGDGGAVRNRAKETVGKGVTGGVLVHVRANPELGCDGPVNGDDHPQALWVFSSDACGVYGLKGVKIARGGKGTPLGQITLHFAKDSTKLEAGAGLLLCTVGPAN